MEIKPIDTLGGRETNYLYLTDCEAPEDAVLGEVDQGWMQLMAGLNVERLILAAIHARDRPSAPSTTPSPTSRSASSSASPIGSFQALQHRLADIATELEAARLMTYWVAAKVDEDPDRMLPREASMVKLFVTETAQQRGARGDADDGRLRLLVRVRHGAPRPPDPGLDDLRRHLARSSATSSPRRWGCSGRSCPQ